MTDKLKLFLLIGQSNMAGRGRLDEVTELTHPQVYMFRNNRWIPAAEPLHIDKPELAGVGLGMSFAVELITGGDLAPIGLLPCAVGGTPLNRWMPGADLYENSLAIAKSALEYGTLSGILWHQGEGDSSTHDDAVSYGERFQYMIQSLRSGLASESVPVIAGELGDFLQSRDDCEFFSVVNEQLKRLEGVLPAYCCVSAKDLTDNGDTLHFNAASLRELGIRYAGRYLDLTENEKESEQSGS